MVGGLLFDLVKTKRIFETARTNFTLLVATVYTGGMPDITWFSNIPDIGSPLLDTVLTGAVAPK